MALGSSSPPGETFSSNFVPCPGPSQLNVAEVEVMLATWRFEGGVNPPGVTPVDELSVLNEGPVTHVLESLLVIDRTCQV